MQMTVRVNQRAVLIITSSCDSLSGSWEFISVSFNFSIFLPLSPWFISKYIYHAICKCIRFFVKASRNKLHRNYDYNEASQIKSPLFYLYI